MPDITEEYKRMLFEEDQWYKENNCDHAHCPDNCEHPQPFIQHGKAGHKNKMYCGRCYHKYNEMNEMIPCTPEVCKENE